MKKVIPLFCTLLVAQLSIIFFFATKKNGLFIDEIWTYNLSNSYFNPFIGNASNFFNTVLDGSFFYNSLTVQQNQIFSYASVFASQAADVHPPLYYCLIHTICSFFPNTFSIWFGLAPNILFFVLVYFFIVAISYDITKNYIFSLASCLIYGFSLGAVSTVLIIRMYAMLTAIIMAVLYIHIKLIDDIYNDLNFENIKYKLLILFLLYFCGFLTHYHFIIFAFIISLLFCLYVFLLKKYKILYIYFIFTVTPILIGFLIFPAAYNHLFHGYRGVSSFNKDSLFSKLFIYNNFLDKELSHLLLFIIIIALILYIIEKLFVIKIKKYRNNIALNIILRTDNEVILDNIKTNKMILILTSLFTYLIIIKTAEIRDSRYIYILYPIISILYTYIIYKMLEQINIKYIFICSIVLLTCINIKINLHSVNIKWLYNDDSIIYNEIKKENNPTFFAITEKEEWWPVTYFVKYFAFAKNIILTTDDTFKKNIPVNRVLFVCTVRQKTEDKKVIDFLMKENNYTIVKQIASDWHGKIYKLEK